MAKIVDTQLPFGRPSGAIPVPGSKKLFTIAAIPGLLCKDVSSHAELEDLGGGVGYYHSTSVDKGFYALFGANARLIGIQKMLRSTAAAVVGKPMRYRATDNESDFPFASKGGISYTTQLQQDGSAEFGTVFDRGPASMTKGCIVLPRQGRFMDATFDLEPTHRFAIVNRADYGFILSAQDGFWFRGWMSNHLSLGPIKRVIHDRKSSLYLGAKSETKQAILQALNELTLEGRFDGDTSIAVVTDYNKGSPNQGKTGFAITAPFFMIEVSVNTIGTAGTYTETNVSGSVAVPTYQRSAPISGAELGLPTFPKIYHFSDLPREVLLDIGTWHRLGENMDFRRNRFKRSDTQVPLTVSIAEYNRLLGSVFSTTDSPRKALAALAASSVPVSDGYATGSDTSALLHCLTHNVCTGYVYSDLMTAVREIYSRAETITRDN